MKIRKSSCEQDAEVRPNYQREIEDVVTLPEVVLPEGEKLQESLHIEDACEDVARYALDGV